MRYSSWTSCFLLCFLFTGCLWDNHRRAETDGLTQIYLTRNFVKKEGRLPYAGGYASGLNNLNCGGGSMHIDSPEAAIAVFALFGIFIVGALIVEGVDHVITLAPSTYVEIWPVGHKEKYHQYLYWGCNSFYYPATFNTGHVPVIVRIHGDRFAVMQLDLPSTTQKPVRLKR